MVALGALMAAPGVAAAAERYVDGATGADTDPACTLADPCATLGYAIANSGAGDEILVDSGTYNESVTLGDGRSLRFHDFVAADGDGPAILDGGAASAITVPASGAGVIRGLRIRGNVSGVTLNGPAEVDSAAFDDPDGGSANGVVVNAAGSGSTIHDSSFTDPAPSPTRLRIGVSGSTNASFEVRDSTFTGLMVGIFVSPPGAAGVLVEGNTVTETHNQPFQGRAIAASSGPTRGPVTIRANTVASATGAGVTGIDVGSNVSLVRNDVSGHQTGVFVGSDHTGVTLEGDRIWGNHGDGLRLFDTGTNEIETTVAAANVTSYANTGVELRADRGTITLDSSIFGAIGWNTESTCVVTHSRADAQYVGGDDPTGCEGFQTSADPMFADASGGDFHLLAASPMIDAGNPADPGLGAVDFDGDDRAIIGSSGCVERRDIGADEFVPAAAVDCAPPQTTLTKAPPKKSKRKRATFRFTAGELGATFECKLDAKPRVACQSPKSYGVKPGRHVFRVWATDAAGNTDPTPARFSFRRLKR